MKAVGYREIGPIDREDALIDFETSKPSPSGQDLLIKVQAVSVNPVDTKIRQQRAPVDIKRQSVLCSKRRSEY